MISSSMQIQTTGIKRRKLWIQTLGIGFLGGVMQSMPAPAFAQQVNNLNISPKRVVFQERPPPLRSTFLTAVRKPSHIGWSWLTG